MQGRALKWIRELIGACGGSGRAAPIDFDGYREQLVHSKFQARQVYRAEVRLWEPAGLARIQGGKIHYPADSDPWEDPPPPRPARPSEALSERTVQELTRIVLAAAEGDPLRCGTWAHDARGTWVWVERSREDARIAVELDASDGVRLGAFCPFRARHSRRSAAISRPRAVLEAQARLFLPDEAILSYSRLCKRPTRRVWSLRWVVGTGPWRGEVRADLNARTGEVVEHEVRLYPRTVARMPADRERAEREILREVRRVVGRGARIGPLVPGVVGEEQKLCWLAAATGPQGTRRVTYCEGKVTLGPLREPA